MRSRLLRGFTARLALVSVYLGLFPWAAPGGPPRAEAKVNPLQSIIRQVKKGNMLVVLDTSGSMTGVPGEPFDAATELGVDCDLGQDCREVTQTGECLTSKQPLTGLARLCSNDAQCRVGACKYGSDPCLQDADCPTVGSICLKDGKPCQYNSDCAPQSSTCKITGASCSSVQACPPAGRCSDTQQVCNNPGASCAVRYCSYKPTLACATDADCQEGAASTTPPSAGLQVHWNFNEAAGASTVVDHAGGDHTGTFVGAAQRGAGLWDTGFALDANVPSAAKVTTALELGNSTTISLWYYPTDLAANQILLDWNSRYQILSWGDGQWGFQMFNDPSKRVMTSTPLLPATWNHLAVTWNSGTANLYLNGQKVATGSVATSISTVTAALIVGSAKAPGYLHPVKGRIDEVRVYSSTLSDAEVRSIYQADNTNASNGLLGHWRLNGNANDSSGNELHASYASAVYAAGPIGTAADKSTGGLITVPNTGGKLNAVTRNLTVSAWFRRAAAAGDMWLVHKELTGSLTYGIRVTSTGFVCGSVSAVEGTQELCSDFSLVNGYGAHVGLTWDGVTGTMKLYINGMLNQEDTLVGTLFGASGRIGLGSTVAGDKDLNDLLGDVRLYSRTLSAAEMSEIHGGPPLAGLVAYWPMDGNTRDHSGNDHTATRQGGTGYVSGKRGQGVQFDGVSGCAEVQVSDAELALSGPFSIAAWTYKTNANETSLVHRKQTSTTSPSYRLAASSANVVTLQTGATTATAGSFALNQWVHYATVSDGTTVKIFENGTLKTSSSLSMLPASSTANTFIGCESDGTTLQKFFAGVLDEVVIYKRALTDLEVQRVYSGTSGEAVSTPTSAPLLGLWKFDEGTGATVADQSVYGNAAGLRCSDASGGNINGTGAGCANALPAWRPGHTGAVSDNASRIAYWSWAQAAGATIDGKLTNQIAISAWVRKTNAQDTRAILSRRSNAGGNARDFWLGVNNGLKLHLTLGSSFVEDTVALPLNVWTHVGATYDGSTAKLYRDGVLVGQTAITHAFTSSGHPLVFGAVINSTGIPGDFLDGEISEVAIWSRALDAQEIVSLKNGATPVGISSGGVCKPNACVAQDNSCNVSLNTCQGGQVNQCLGVNSSDVCVISASNKGPAKMCRFEQVFCAVDAHCTRYPNDECVPATSRSVVAKRVLRNVLLNNADIMNFGLMGFSQGSPDGTTWDRNGDGLIDAGDKDGRPDDYYFPYFKVTTGTGSTKFVDRYFPRDELATHGCYSKTGGPSATCTIGSITYTWRSGVNARYTVFKNGSFVQLDQPYCGEKCVVFTQPQGWLLYEDDDDYDDDDRFTDARGTSLFSGAHYQYAVSSGTYDTWDKPLFRDKYEGRNITISGDPYVYFKPRNDYYWDPKAGANRPPIKGAQCGSQCSMTCGGNFDPALFPMMDVSDDPTTSKANLQKMLPMLEKAADGGFMHWERGPVGCALLNDFAEGPVPAPADRAKHSAWDYMSAVKAGDTMVCRDNFILLITDGETNGPGDVDANGVTSCDNPDCRVQWDDPNATVGATCQCKSVTNALKLRKAAAMGGLNVKTYVIGFSPDAVIGTPATINENIARAGGTCRAPGDPATASDDKCMFLATNETELQEAIQNVIFDAIKGSYSTTPASAIGGVQNEGEITPGGILFDARVDFPSWRGHLLAYDTKDIDPGTGQPKLMWDAGSPANFPDPNDVLAYRNWTGWKNRRIYTSAGANMVKIQVDPSSGAIVNRDELLSLGLGNTNDEAERIAQWMLGDPRQRNKAVLGAFVNSTPIEVGPPGLTSLPGGKKFHEDLKNRVSLVYAAGDDGLLHAFFTRDTTVGGVAYKGGEEAFAYIPPDMLQVVTNLYVQGGQKADPRAHIYGLTSSPKVKNLCWTNCDDDATAVWKTVMVMTDGWGGTEAFMLDITNPFSGGSVGNPPLGVLWHTDTVMPADKALYDDYLGKTVSVPAFYFGKSASKDDHRVVFASGYRSTPPTSAAQGITLVNTSIRSGGLLDADTITPSGCSTVELTTLTDVAAARNFDFREQQQLLGAFFGDTWGNLWRYVPAQVGAYNDTGTTGALSLVKAFGCAHPLHFSPTVVQMDRDDPLNHPGEVYVVQVTNSALDPETESFAASRLVVRKEKRTSVGGGMAADETWVTGGQVELVAGSGTLCGVFDPNGGGGAGSCSQDLPANARPTSTPLAILKADGAGFQIISLWYAPPEAVCGSGRSYLALHEVNVNSNQIVQKAGFGLIDEPVTSAVIVGKKVVYTDSQGKVHDVSNQLNQTFVAGGAISDLTRNGGLRFQQTGWMEVP